MADNDYQDDFENIQAGLVWGPGGVRTNVAFFFGPASNVNIYDRLQCDNNSSCIIEVGGSGLYTLPEVVDRGAYVYPMIIDEGQATIIFPFFDFEASNDVFVSALTVSNSWGAGVLIDGGFFVSPDPSGTMLTIDGGPPIVAQSVDFAGTAEYIVDVLSPPISPLVLEYDNFNGIPVVNPADAQYINVVN